MTSTVVAPDSKADRRRANQMSDRSRAENRLGQKLVLPAVVLMLLVTAFPMVRALYLCLFSYSLTAPDDREFMGLQNYGTALTDSLFWETPSTPSSSWWSRWPSSW